MRDASSPGARVDPPRRVRQHSGAGERREIRRTLGPPPGVDRTADEHEDGHQHEQSRHDAEHRDGGRASLAGRRRAHPDEPM